MSSTKAPVASGERGASSWWLRVLLLVPTLTYAGALAISILLRGMITFEVVDQAVAAFLVIHLLVGLWAVGQRNRTVRFLLLTGLTLIALAFVELAAWQVLPSVPNRVPRPPGRRQAGTLLDGLPGLSGREYSYAINPQGLRAPEVRIKDHAVRILTVGGSTTECMYVPERETWPWALQDGLAERTGASVFVGNAGAAGHTTLHHAYQIRHFELVPEFNWVVVLCGINDLELTEAAAARIPVAQEALTLSYANKAVYRSMALVRLLEKFLAPRFTPRTVVQDDEAGWVAKQREVRADLLRQKTLHELPREHQEHLNFYRSNLLKIILAARSRGVKLVLMTQPALYRKDLPPELEKLLWMGSREEHAAGTAAYYEQVLAGYNRVMREVCAQERVDCLDLAALLPRDTTVFYDDCHFNPGGCQQVAALLIDFFASQLGESRR